MSDEVLGTLAGVKRYEPAKPGESAKAGQKPGKAANGRTDGFADKYVKISWTKGWEDDYQRWSESGTASGELPGAWPFLPELVGEFINVSFKRQDDGKHGKLQFCVTFSQAVRERLGKPFLLSSWGSSVEDAYLSCLFKHRVVLDCDWDNEVREDGDVPFR